ncbi:carboxymuconolactone decarboxylase family protein [Azospirillum canadense]|uniref:carboxymuconolactone decarboxylase family protein n=1 Tax=Azospirillum canadense TaxID=403962 RepID=UPI0022272A0F|nr:carboxymuconolactone decarboxylase family protein [Azospirillum canadense]MCW2241446.1 AhpD family alkylhydroperoxidase [Azospirillum canadense]
MQPRLNYGKAAPEGRAALLGVEAYLDACGLEASLRELIKVRVSQINGCAYCIDLHCRDARAAGETEQRLYALNAWRETPFFTPREQAALAWAEALTRLGPDHVPDAVFDAVRARFDDKELADLTIAVAMINAWNRIGVGFRLVPGANRAKKD